MIDPRARSRRPPAPAIRTLVLGLGNDLLADDAVGLLAARALQESLEHRAEVRQTSAHGVALLDQLIGYDRVILIDAVRTGTHRPGSVMTVDARTLSAAYAPSPHYTGLPELLALAHALELDFPKQTTIVAVEVEDTSTLGGSMTPAVRAAVSEVCRRVDALLDQDA